MTYRFKTIKEMHVEAARVNAARAAVEAWYETESTAARNAAYANPDRAAGKAAFRAAKDAITAEYETRRAAIGPAPTLADVEEMQAVK